MKGSRPVRQVLLVLAAVVVAAITPAAAQEELHEKIEGYFAQIRPHGLYGNERAAQALIALAPSLHTARPEFVTALSDTHMVVRWTAARVLGLIGPEAKDAVPALTQALPTSEWYAQVMVAWALSRMGPAAAEATPALVKVLQTSRDVWVKREAAMALGAIGPQAREALPVLTSLLKDANGFVRVAAATSLYQIGRDNQGFPVLLEALRDPYIVGPRVAADVLAELGEGARPMVPALIDTLKDPAPCARVAAARALWLIDRNTQGTEALVGALKDPQLEVRQRASEALRLIGAATGQTFPEPVAPAEPQDTRPKPLVYKAEEWTGPPEAIVKNQGRPDKWNLWSKGAPAWSRGIILAGPTVTTDRSTPEEGAPVLHTRLTGIPEGTYTVTVEHARPLGVSLDAGKTWRKLDENSSLGLTTIKDGTFDLWVDDRYAAATSPGPVYYNTVTFTPATPQTPGRPVQGWATERVREKLDRGAVALRTADGVYLSWRLLETDPQQAAFGVYRTDGSGPAKKLNTAPITQTTDFLDGTAPTGTESRYSITIDGKPETSLPAPATALPYLPIKLQGNYRALNIGIGDLDGDGRLDYVIRQPDVEIWGFLYTWYRSPDTYKLEAYNADGKFLWRQSMGWGVEMGVWFAPYLVHDLDGDGRAEIAFKGADADPRDAEGMCNEGAEYVTVLDGRTGEVRCRAPWPSRDDFGFSAKPGDIAARNQLAIAYLDGKTPCLIAERGTYGLQKVIAYQMKGNTLETLWKWDNSASGRAFRGQGAHTLHAADVDGDGRDEVILGSSVLEDDGTPLWSTGMGHPDVCCVGDFDAANPGLEISYTLENPQKQNGVCMVDARTGKVLWGRQEPTIHVGWGLASDLDATRPGCEAWAREDPKTGAFSGPPPCWLYSAEGKLIAEGTDAPTTTTVAYWDADVQRELIRGGRASDYQGGAYPPYFEGSVIAVADVIGDWREEVITALPGEVRIYSTTIPAADRRPCLLQDPTYRLAVDDICSGYYSQPMLGYLPAQNRSTAFLTGPQAGLDPAAPNACEAVVLASPTEAVSGTLHLSTGNASAVIQPADLPVSVPAGESLRLPFSLRLTKPPSPLSGRTVIPVTASLQSDSGAKLEARTDLPVIDRPMTGVPLVGAGDFLEQSGGEARLRTDKPNSGGRALSHWNYKGHRISWQITLPQTGRYHLAIRYANSWGWVSERGLLVDGKPLPGAETVKFPPVGTVLDEWATMPVRLASGAPAAWELTAGPHRITMENTNDCWLNLDQLAFVPVPAP